MARPDTAWPAGVAALICAASVGLAAHRRDEHLQAARIGIELDHVAVELDITPGLDVAGDLIAAIDGDRDGILSDTERDGFARRAVERLACTIDGEAHALRLVSASVPDLASLRRGEGTIRLHARATIDEPRVGAHHLRFVNDVAIPKSAYLANALVPDSPRLMVTAQHRSVDQRDVTIDYTVGGGGRGAWAAPLAWSMAAACIALPLAYRVFQARARSSRA